GLRGEFAVPRESAERRGLWAESFDGMKLLWNDRLLRTVLILAPLINFAFTGAMFTVILGLRRNGVSAFVIGITEAVIMVGGLIGAVIAPRLRERMTIRQAVLLITVAGSLMMLVAAAVIPSPYVAIPLALPFILSPATNAALFSLILRRTPPATHG